MALAADLLTRGYFPRELPPAFTTTDFGTFVGDLGLRALLAAPQPRSWTKPVSHNHGISFYDPTARLTDQRGPAGAAPGGTLTFEYW